MSALKVLVILSLFAVVLSLESDKTFPHEGQKDVKDLNDILLNNVKSSEASLITETEPAEKTEELSRQKRSCYTAQVRTRSGRIISVRRCNG